MEAPLSEATEEAMEVIKDCKDEKAVAGSSKILLIFVDIFECIAMLRGCLAA